MKKPPYISQHLNKNFSEADKKKLSNEELEFWTHRTCGIACVLMVIKSKCLETPSFYELFKKALYQNGYSSAGWKHTHLADLINDYGAGEAQARPLTHAQIEDGLEKGNYYIVSVTHMFPVDGSKGGHLVLLYGMEKDIVFFNDPSTWGEKNGQLKKDEFFASYSGRCIEVLK